MTTTNLWMDCALDYQSAAYIYAWVLVVDREIANRGVNGERT